MAFSKLNVKAATKPVEAVKTETVHVAVVDTPKAKPIEIVKPAAEVVVEEVANRSVSLFGAMGNMGAALLAATDLPTFTPAAFPTLVVSGGLTGGAFTPASYVDEAIANQLPQGKKPIDCVFLGFRSEGSIWPVGYNDRAEGTSKPVASFAVGMDAPDDGNLLALAAKSYQFTKTDLKPGWDHAKTGMGHIRPRFGILVYLPDADDVIVIQTPEGFTHWNGSLENLKQHMDPKTKELSQFPCQLRVVTTVKNLGGNDVATHVFAFTKVVTESGKQWWDAAAKWIQTAGSDEETREKIEAWVSGSDRPLTDSIRDVLRKASTFKA